MISNLTTGFKPKFAGVAGCLAAPAREPQAAQTESPSHSVPGLAPKPLYFKALITPQITAAKPALPRFGHLLNEKDYVISHRVQTPVNGYAANKTLRAFILRDLVKREQGDASTLKHALSAYASTGFEEDEAALADNLLLLNRGVDTVVTSHSGPASIPTLMMSRLLTDPQRPEDRGHTYMSQDATISLGPIDMYLGGKNHDQQIRRERCNEAIRDRETLIMFATGETDRAKVYADLNSQKSLSSLQALSYGKHGLVDAILVGEDQLLTRDALDRIYKLKRLTTREAIDRFNETPGALDELLGKPAFRKLLTPLAEFSPSSIPGADASRDENRAHHYLSAKDAQKPQLTTGTDQQLQAGKMINANRLQIFARPIDDPEFKLMNRIPFLTAKIGAMPDIPSHIQLKGAMPSEGLVYDDIIMFQDGFDDATGEQVSQALVALKEKKLKQNDRSNVKILINSPGGSVWAGQDISNTIRELGEDKVKVDVIVQGMAASCGAWNLVMATGNKLATPLARIMIHQAASANRGSNRDMNEFADGTQDVTDVIIKRVADVSGRSVRDVTLDFRQDSWLNTLEAMFYGPKGLLDGIVVGPETVITREDVQKYLETDPEVQAFLTGKFGKNDPEKNVARYIQQRLDDLREPNRTYKPVEWEQKYGRDPFSNPIRTIMTIAADARKFKDIEALKGSATRPQNVIDQYVVGEKPFWLGAFGDDSASRNTFGPFLGFPKAPFPKGQRDPIVI